MVGGGLKRAEGTWIDRAHDEHLRLRLWPARRWQPEAFVQYAHSEPQRLQGRFVAGLGPRLVLVDRPRGRLSTAALPMFEEERLTRDGLADDGRVESVFRLSAYLRGDWRSNRGTGLGGVVWLQPRIDEPRDLRVLANARLSLPIAGPLALELAGGSAGTPGRRLKRNGWESPAISACGSKDSARPEGGRRPPIDGMHTVPLI